MAIKLEDKPNVISPNGTYPYGDIKDDTGIGDGTPISREVYADFHQFFAKMLAESGITANGLADNAANGFQYWDAFARFTSVGSWITLGNPIITTAGFSSVTSTYNKLKIIGNIAFWKCNVQYILSAPVSNIEMDLPTVITTGLGMTINPSAPYSFGSLGIDSHLVVVNGDGFGYPHISLLRQDGTNFPSTGGTASFITFDITLELV